MAERAGEKHRKKTQESKQSQDGTPEQSVQDAATSIVTTNTIYSFTRHTYTLTSVSGTDHNLYKPLEACIPQ